MFYKIYMIKVNWKLMTNYNNKMIVVLISMMIKSHRIIVKKQNKMMTKTRYSKISNYNKIQVTSLFKNKFLNKIILVLKIITTMKNKCKINHKIQKVIMYQVNSK